ncbi:MAG TPA: DUF3103 family protein [Polyangiaceae bacterium]|nr:DUF3103 family protein [Polyangiaceae bacterium]
MTRTNVSLLGVFVGVALFGAGCAHDEGGPGPEPVGAVAPAADLQAMKRDAAFEVSRLLGDASFRDALGQSFARGETGVRLAEVWSAAPAGAAARLASLDAQIVAQKGLGGYASSLLQVRLVRPEGDAGEIDWASIPVAFLPAGDEKGWSLVEAFDAQGRALALDAEVAPAVPVLVAGIDAREETRAGVALLNDELAAHGIGGGRGPLAGGGLGQRSSALATSTPTSMLTRVRLNDDKEPWVSGASEVYALVSGIDPVAAQVRIEAVDMPYLDNDGKDYYPNQILIFWEGYRFAAANVVLYEHDDNTNYQTLVQALVSAVGAGLDLSYPGASMVAEIANRIIAAMPGGWFSNDDDYVDVFYTLEKGATYTDRMGVSGNAKISLVPYTLLGN